MRNLSNCKLLESLLKNTSSFLKLTLRVKNLLTDRVLIMKN